MSDISKITIELAKDGDAKALEILVRGLQDRVYHLARRMVYDPNIAQDATQEILIRIITKLSTFQGDSKFETWAYRVATNYLLTAKKVIAADPGLSFQMYSDDLLDDLADESAMAPDDHIMLNELRVKCTMAMLLCLDRNHRAAYVLGEVFEFDHGEAAFLLDVSPANFRKRLSRARADVQAFTAAACGLANSAASCSCPKRLARAMSSGRIGSEPSLDVLDAPRYEDVQEYAANVASDLRTAKLQRATGPLKSQTDFGRSVLEILEART